MAVEKASLNILGAFDVGFEMDLKDIEAIFKVKGFELFRHQPRSKGFERENRPLRIQYKKLKYFLYDREFDLDVLITFFDIGAFSIELNTDISCWEIAHYPQACQQILTSKELDKILENIAKEIFQEAKAGIDNPELGTFHSTFVVFNVHRLNRVMEYSEVIGEYGDYIAKTLRNSDEAIGFSEVRRTLTPHVTYSDQDIVFTATNVAVVFDETSSEVVDIFEFAHVQSLQVKVMDLRLDLTLQALYEDNEKAKSFWRSLLNFFDSKSRKLNTIYLDTIVIMERTEQSFKFASDSYLIRVHELAIQKMFLPLYSQGIERKLVVIKDIVSDLRDRSNALRMEMLEWIIVLLIALEIIKSFTK